MLISDEKDLCTKLDESSTFISQKIGRDEMIDPHSETGLQRQQHLRVIKMEMESLRELGLCFYHYSVGYIYKTNFDGIKI